MARPKPGPPEPPPRPAGPDPGPDPAPRPGAVRKPVSDAERRFGERLRKAREEIGMKPGEAAEALGVSPARIPEYESGRIMPPVLRLMDMVRVLGLAPETLFPEWFEGWERKKPKKTRD